MRKRLRKKTRRRLAIKELLQKIYDEVVAEELRTGGLASQIREAFWKERVEGGEIKMIIE